MNTKYLLDTNVLISMFRNKGNVRSRILQVSFKNCYVSEITIAELFYGAAKGGNKKNFEDIKNVLRQFEIIPIYPCLEKYGLIKADLEHKGLRIDEFDLLIGATALQNNLILVTANIKHLTRIPRITIENWEM